MWWRNNTSAFEMTVPASSVKSSALQGALYCWIKNNNLSTFTLNHALRSNANYATASPRFIINFLKTLSIICSRQLKISKSSLNPFSFKFSSKFLKIALLILVPSAKDKRNAQTSTPLLQVLTTFLLHLLLLL